MRIETNELTLNKAVKALLIENCVDAKRLEKKHVAGCGYVHYIKDSNNNTLGHIHKSSGQMLINLKNVA
jgi:hypothetical protein